MLYIRDLQTGRTRPIEGSEAARYPFWSPDSESIAFFQGFGGLVRTGISGGSPRRIAEVTANYSNGKGGAWNEDGVIIFSPDPNAPLFSIDSDGGVPMSISQPDAQRDELSHRHPFFLPRGDALVYVRRGTRAISDERRVEIWARTLDGSVDHKLLESVGNAQYSRGHLLYAVDGSLVARPFDESTLRFTGEARRIAESVLTLPGASLTAFDVNESGQLVYVRGDQAAARYRLVWRDRSGAELEVLREDTDILDARLSQDGDRLLVRRINPALNVAERVVIDLATNREWLMDEDIPSDASGLLSPDGTRYAHWTNDANDRVVYVQPVDSLAPPRPVARLPREAWFVLCSWTPDGEGLLAIAGDPGSIRLLKIDVEGDSEPTLFVNADIGDMHNVNPSPDGAWITFEQVDQLNRHVFIAPIDAVESAVRVSDVSSSQTRWRADGGELFFLTEDGVICSVSIESDDVGASRINAAVALFDIGAQDYAREVYSVSPDGERFLVVEPMWRDHMQDITYMSDWLATMER